MSEIGKRLGENVITQTVEELSQLPKEALADLIEKALAEIKRELARTEAGLRDGSMHPMHAANILKSVIEFMSE
jgi:hypothetical protein